MSYILEKKKVKSIFLKFIMDADLEFKRRLKKKVAGGAITVFYGCSVIFLEKFYLTDWKL